jgi:hypothetical protein
MGSDVIFAIFNTGGIRNSVCEAYLEKEEICRREWRRRKREKGVASHQIRNTG